MQIEWKDIDVENRIVRVKLEKGSYPRAPVSLRVTVSYDIWIRKNSKRIFGSYTLAGFAFSLYKQRKKTSMKLQNPRIAQITIHISTLESHNGIHRTKDILYVMQMLGHKNIKNTLVCTQLLPFKEDDQFICKVATNTTEECKLIEDGFTFITGEYNDGDKIFRKPK